MTDPCPYCGRYMIAGHPSRKPTRDHVDPKIRAKGKPFNTLRACHDCNQNKDRMTLPEWLTYLTGRQVELKIQLDLFERRIAMVDYLVKCGLK